MKTSIAVALLFIVMPAVHASPLVGDAGKGRQIAGVCMSCHGEKGHALLPTYPNLSGQNVPYLIDALKAYKNGGRSNPIMAPMAKALTDQQIADIAAYFGQFK